MTTNSIPQPAQPIAGGLRVDATWYRWLRDIETAARQAGGEAEAQFEALCRKLGSQDGTIEGIPDPSSSSVVGGQGVRVTGDPAGAQTITATASDGVIVRGPTTVEAFASIDDTLTDTASTGLRNGGIGTVVGGIGVGNTVNVSAGFGSILDITTPTAPTYTEVSWDAFTGVAIANTGVVLTWWYIDSAGALQQQTTKPTDTQYRDRIYLFRTALNGGVITSLVSVPNPLQNTAANLGDLARALGTMYVNGGGRFTPDGANLLIRRSAGTLVSWGGNYAANAKDPHEVQIPAATPAQFRMVTATGAPGAIVTAIPVGFYDNAGTVTAIGGGTNASSIFTIWQYPSGNVHVQYDNATYGSLTAAREALTNGTRSFVANPLVAAGDAICAGYIIATRTATALNNSGQAIFLPTNRFGLLDGGAAASTLAQWGSITGTITNQADLVAYVASQVSASTGTVNRITTDGDFRRTTQNDLRRLA